MQVLSPWKNAEWSIFLFLDHSIIAILFSFLKVYFKAKQYLPINSKGFLIINPCTTLGNSPAADTEFCNSPYLWQIYLIRCPQGAAVCYKAGRIILSHLRKAGHKEKKKKTKKQRMINFVLATVYCWSCYSQQLACSLKASFADVWNLAHVSRLTSEGLPEFREPQHPPGIFPHSLWLLLEIQLFHWCPTTP